MEIIITAIISLFAGIISKELTANSAENAEAKLMDKQKENQEELNENAFNRQAEFWKDNESPQALFDQYSNLGASETAALQAVLGTSPMSGPVSSSGSASGGSVSNVFSNDTLSQLMQTLQNSINSEFENKKTAAETEGINEQNKWIGTLNQANVDNIYSRLWIDNQHLNLDKDIFEQITKPYTQSMIDLNYSQIEKNQQEITNLCAEFLNICQQLKVLQATERNLDASSAMLGAQRENFSEDTKRLQYENRIRAITARLSEIAGIDVTADWKTQAAQIPVRTSEIILDQLYPDNNDPAASDMRPLDLGSDDFLINGKKVSSQDFAKITDAASKKAVHVSHVKEETANAFNHVKDYMNRNYRDQTHWTQKGAYYLDKAAKWIDRNTRYGMN